MNRSYSISTLLQLRGRVPRPQSPNTSSQQVEEEQDGAKVCRRTRVTVEPIPSFALSSEESGSESSEGSESKIAPRHQASSTQDSPFGWCGEHLSRFQDLAAVACKICKSTKRRTWWPVVLLETCARAGCERCILRLLAMLKVIGRDRIGPDMQYSQLQFQTSIIILKFRSGLRGSENRGKKAPFFPWASQPIKIELYTSPEQYALGWAPLLGTGRDVMQDRRTHCSSLIMAWLDSCSAYHTRCGKYINSLPPRVIDVGTSEAPNVCLRSTLGVRATYIVLSYSFDECKYFTLSLLIPPLPKKFSNIDGSLILPRVACSENYKGHSYPSDA